MRVLGTLILGEDASEKMTPKCRVMEMRSGEIMNSLVSGISEDQLYPALSKVCLISLSQAGFSHHNQTSRE